MTAITDEIIDELVQLELESANKTHGNSFHSHHEAYAVILEEFQEMKHSKKMFHRHLRCYWHLIKHDMFIYMDSTLDLAEEEINSLIKEAIQVKAMLYKARNNLKEKDE